MTDNSSLKSLHTALIDARKGYETALKDAEEGEMKALFRKMIAQHEAAHREVHRLLTSRGETPDDDGSFMSTVHKTVISVRAAVSGLGRNALSSFADGEERIVETYDEAIAENAGNTEAAKTLKAQRSALRDRIGEMKAKAA